MTHTINKSLNIPPLFEDEGMEQKRRGRANLNNDKDTLPNRGWIDADEYEYMESRV